MLHQCGHSSGGGPATPPCSFSILFPMDEPSNHTTPSSYTSVDCTLSLGTPSTRAAPIQRSMSSLCWDLISNSGKHTTRGSSSTADSVGGSSSNLGGDPFLLARRCANCDTTSTPLWRNGPRGPKSLCNACGIRYKKEERRAAASPSPSSSSSSVATGAAAGGYSFQRPPQHPWSCYAPTEFRVMTGNDDEEDYLSWRLNVVPTAQFQVQDLFQYQ